MLNERSKRKCAHPYIPNSSPYIQKEMLREIGVESMDQLYSSIPDELKFKGVLNLPDPLQSEADLKRHVEGILSKNRECDDYVSFLGGGCWQHYVPAICDEINRRSEFLTAYAGEPWEDHGRWQALFEYQSLVAELVEMDVVNVPTYSWGQAAATSIRMACRITKRDEVLISDTISPERLAIIRNYCEPVVKILLVKHDPETGMMDLDDLNSKISEETAAVYFENPSYLGPIETHGAEISDALHRFDALIVVGVDPISLGVIVPPSRYDADIVCGELQPLGIHMNFGGGLAGFIATPDEEKFVMEYPSRLFGITKTIVDGEYGFGDVAFERTSFERREKAKEFVGTAAALWGITAGVYLSLMGPYGMQMLGKTIMQRSQYAMKLLSEIPGVVAPRFKAPHFKEFVVDFNGTSLSVDEINRNLLSYNIFGGIDLTDKFPELGASALYCVTELHTKESLDRLAHALKKIIEGGIAK
ncbi:MAG: aminomethyl-transferring glycine dehydrogenase subunit GcvPA [archaeon GB-1845-036]|nr:aminomethyl-transferring glycine dehydrogenase subunit GcvPA [Candidatus Culexmicrobium thermophilum]